MDISYLVLYGGLFIVALLCLSRLFAIVLSRILSILVKKDISIDYIGIGSLKNVRVQLNSNSTLAIDAIWLTWKLLNPTQSYPAVLHIGDMRIQADIGQSTLEMTSTQRNVNTAAKTQGSSFLDSGYFVSTVKFFIQVLSIDIEAISIVLLHVNTMGIDALLHTTVSNIKLSGEVLTDKILSADFAVEQTAVRILRSAQQEANKESAVAQASTQFKISTQFNITEKSLLGVSVTVSSPSVSLHDGFLLPGNSPVIHVPPHIASTVHSSSTPTVEKITAIFKQIPKDIKIEIDNACFKINLQTQHRALMLNSKSVCFTAELDSDYMISCNKSGDFLLPSAMGQFFCTDVQLTNLQARKLFSLTNVTTDMQVRETGISADVSVRHCHANYADKEFSFWAHVIKEYKVMQRTSRPHTMQQQSSSPPPKSDVTLEQVRPINFIEQFCLPVDVTFDLNDMSSHMTWPKMPSCAAVLASLRSAVHITTDAGSVTQKPFRYIRGSIQGEQLYCNIGDSIRSPPGGAVPGKHVWGTPCAINTVNIKVNITPVLLEVEGAVQSLQLESSQEFQQVIHHCVETLCALRSSMGDGDRKPRVRPVEASISRPSRRYQMLLRLEDIDAFVCSDIPECLTLRVNGIEVDLEPDDSAVTIEGIKLQRLKQKNKVHHCYPYANLPEGVIDIKEITCSHTAANKRLLVEVQESCSARWTTTTHMSIYHHTKEISMFVKNTKEMISPTQAEESVSESNPMLDKNSLRLALNVRKLDVYYDVSSTQKNYVVINELYAEKQGGQVLKATSTHCVIGFDGHPIFNIKGLLGNQCFDIERATLPSPHCCQPPLSSDFTAANHFLISEKPHFLESVCIEKLVNNPQLLDDRSSFENLTLATNRAWGVFAKSLEVEFPNQYDFAANYNEIINLKKWFKMLHSSKKGPSYEEPLYADMLIRIQTIVVQIHDDPFEVKLGDNYELMKDEKKESKIREQLLDDKVSELRQTHGELLPAKQINELYLALERKNMDIYVKRSQRLYSSSPMRKALLMLTVTGAEISALADPTINGKENIVSHMREIDSTSPNPDEGLDFTTLWCRFVRGTTKTLNLQIRDYPQSLWEMEDWHFWGRVLGAEIVGASRARRECTVEVGAPWGNVTVSRSMPPLKFYHDLATDVTGMHLAYGPTIEPAWATVNLAMDLLNKPSVDPSKPLAFWDKMRLLYHGRLTASVQQCNVLWLATRDPYNTTECLDWEWKNVYLDWTNAHWLIKGDLDVYVRTASKYDDVRFVHFPNFRFEIGLEWLCNGDPNEHHSIMPCAPDKVPEHSPNQVHDSYASIRSQNLNLKLSLDIKGRKEEDGIPECLFYSTTMRWLQNFQATVIGGVTRPTRRGKLFNNTKPRKPQLSRHYKCVDFNAKFPTFQVNYWASFNKQRGIEMCLGKGSLTSKHSLQLLDISDGLIHRPRADWSITELDFDIAESHAYLYTAAQENDNQAQVFTKPPADKHHMATVARVVYSRQQSQSDNDVVNPDLSNDDLADLETELDDNEKNEEKDFTHKLVVTEFCGSWTRFNRDAVIGLYDSYNKAQMLKHNLSTEALKEIKVDSSAQARLQTGSTTPVPNNVQGSSSANTPSPMTKLQTGYGATLLNQLLSEATTKFMVFSEENSGGREQFYGMKACTTNDVMLKNWHIELVNSQVMLKGRETSGYAIVSAVNVQLTSCAHWPAWRDNQLTNKTTWVGKLDGLQYFATVESPSGNDEGEVKWIPLSIIERTISSLQPSDLPDMVGSGESVGGVVSDTVGAHSEDACGESGVQLQRIMSRCNCQVYYASYGGNVDPNIAAQIVHPDANKKNEDEEEDGLWSKEEAVDSMTLVYHDLDMCTNSAQYDMIMDIINNLLLYVEPKRKEAMARMQHMRFALQLSSIADQKIPIVQLQHSLRNLLSEMRQLEKNLHNKQRALEDATGDTSNLYVQIRELETEVTEVKESLANASENLQIMVSCYKEFQLQRVMKRKLEEAQSIRVIRRVEVCIGLAHWKLTEEDGQLGIADLQLRQFKYTRTSKSDDSGENIMELGWVYINNLVGNDIYKEVLRPQEASSKGKQVALRVIARGKPPVGGISVTENFEVNVVPLNIQLSYRFFKTMMAFFFPGRDVDHTPTEEQAKGLDDDPEPGSRFSRTGSLRSTSSAESLEGTLSRDTPAKAAKKGFFFRRQKDDIDKMKERAARNNTFFYIKISAVPLCVSYKGEKDKNLEDVTNFHLTLPSLEYHNCTWTWLDLLMAMKKEYKQALLSQAIKEKLKFRIGHKEDTSTGNDTSGDADKAKLLMGAKASNIATEEKSSKRALFGKGPSSH